MDIPRRKLITIRLKLFSLILLILFVHPGSRAQPDSNSSPQTFQSDNLYHWGSISSFHGLPSENVNAIAQTPDGVLWFGTEKGLAKFDGRRVQTITVQNLSILRILALKVSSDDVLWIATENGVVRFQDETFIPLEETRDKLIKSIYVSDIGKNIFFAGDGGLVYEVSKVPEKGYLARIVLNEDNDIRDISQAADSLVVGTYKRGILRFDGETLTESQEKPRFINSFAKDNVGNLWVGAQTFTDSSGLYRAKNINELENIDAAVGSVTSLSFDGMGNLWVGTKDRGAFQFKDGIQQRRFTFENTAGGLRSNDILTTFVDRENVIWFGTTKGVCRFDPSGPTNAKLSEDIQSNFIRTLYRTKSGQLLAGTNRGLFKKTENNVWIEIAGFDSAAVYSIFEDENNLLLIGTTGGFYYDVDPNSDSRKQYAEDIEAKLPENENIRAIEEFKGETYLGFFGRGLAHFDAEKISFDRSNSDLTQITALHSDNDRILWIGTAKNGIFRFDGNQITQIPQLAALKNVAVWSIDGGAEKDLWFGTEQGLFFFRNGTLEKLLADTNVHAVREIVDSNGQIESVWCATVSGLVQIAPDKNFDWVFSRFDVEQGLSSQSAFAVLPEFSGDKLESVLVGTNRGIAEYKVSKIRPLVITTRILSKRLHSPSELNSGIDLEYPQNSLAVEVAGLSSRTFPEQFQYGFLLRNSKGELINKRLSDDSQFLMENLEAGTYSVEIIAYDKNLTPSEPMVFSFSIASAPFPWTTLALTVLLAFAVVALIWAIFSQRRISRTSNELEFANKELNTARLDLANEAERERRRISRDLHDQTLADLRHLLLLTDKLPTDEDSTENASVFRSEIENVSNEIRNICEDLSPSVLENIGFTAALEWALSNSLRDSRNIVSSEFNCDETTDEHLTFTPHIQIQIFRIVQEVLSNIVQHSTATNISLTIHKMTAGSFSLTIEDNGQKFDPKSSSNSRGRGLKNIQARANLLEAEVSWRTKKSGGNAFELRKT